MPKGIRGSREVVIAHCPICSKKYGHFKGVEKKTCSVRCGAVMRSLNSLGRTNESKTLEDVTDRVVSEHLKTMFVGGHDGSVDYGNNHCVLYNEGEIL